MSSRFSFHLLLWSCLLILLGVDVYKRQGLLALDGSVMILLDGETVLMQNSFP